MMLFFSSYLYLMEMHYRPKYICLFWERGIPPLLLCIFSFPHLILRSICLGVGGAGFPGSSDSLWICLHWRKLLFDSWVGKIRWRRRDRLPAPVFLGFPGGSDGKESACNAGDLSLILGWGRSPGEGHGNPLQYSCLENLHGLRSLAGYSPGGSQRVRHSWASNHSISAGGQCCSCRVKQVQSQGHKPFQSEQLFSQEKTPSLGNMFRDVYRHFKISVSEPSNLTIFFKAQFTYFFLLINFYWSVVPLQCVLVSGIQQSESRLHILISTLL